MPLDYDGEYYVTCYNSDDSDHNTWCASSGSSNSTMGNAPRAPDASDAPPPPPPPDTIDVEEVTTTETLRMPYYAIETVPNVDIPGNSQSRQIMDRDLSFVTGKTAFIVTQGFNYGAANDQSLDTRLWYYRVPGAPATIGQPNPSDNPPPVSVTWSVSNTTTNFENVVYTIRATDPISGTSLTEVTSTNFLVMQGRIKTMTFNPPQDPTTAGWYYMEFNISCAGANLNNQPAPAGREWKFTVDSATTTVPVGFQKQFVEAFTLPYTAYSALGNGQSATVNNTNGVEPANGGYTDFPVRDLSDPFYGLPPAVAFAGRVEFLNKTEGEPGDLLGGRGYASDERAIIQLQLTSTNLPFHASDYETAGTVTFAGVSGGLGEVVGFFNHVTE